MTDSGSGASYRALRVGLTGGVASGKSTVTDLFAAHGAPIIDADVIARQVVETGSPLLAHIAERFGAEVLSDDGSLDRRRLREIVFQDTSARRDLERLTHPAIRERMEATMRACKYPYLIAAVPLLVEGGLDEQMDRVLVVDVPEEVQIARLIARDDITPTQASAMIAAQASRETRLEVADDIIDNSGAVEELVPQVRVLHTRYLELAATGVAP